MKFTEVLLYAFFENAISILQGLLAAFMCRKIFEIFPCTVQILIVRQLLAFPAWECEECSLTAFPQWQQILNTLQKKELPVMPIDF